MANVQINGSPLYQFQLFGTGITASSNIPFNVALKSILQTSGTLLDQCNLVHAKRYTFAVSTPQTLDLFGGTLTDLFGGACVFARVKLLIVKLYTTTNGQALILGAAGANEWAGAAAPLSASGTLTVASSTANNDGYFVLSAPNTTGYAVTTSNKLLKLNPGTGAFDVDVVIAGCDA